MTSTPPTAATPPPPREGTRLRSPFFELGPKNLLRLPEIIEVGLAAQTAGRRYDVAVILTVPTPLIAPVHAAVPDVLVFAQSMDDDELGPSFGRVTAESLVDAGARGVMLNHDSYPLESSILERTVRRAHENGLMTIVCAGSETQVLEIVPLAPTVILFEPPSLIGKAGGGDRSWIAEIDLRVRAIAPDVLMMHAGGVATPADAQQIMCSGAAGTGSTSGVLNAASPSKAVGLFLAAVRSGFELHQNGV